MKGECHWETEAEARETSMSGIIAVSGASSFSDVILCKHCLLKDVRSAGQQPLLYVNPHASSMLLKLNCNLLGDR